MNRLHVQGLDIFCTLFVSMQCRGVIWGAEQTFSNIRYITRTPYHLPAKSVWHVYVKLIAGH